MAASNSLATVDFTTYARAPALKACRTISGASCWLTITISVSGRRRLISRVASKPFIRGMVTSMTMMSGRRTLAFSTASLPSTASPQRVNEDSVASTEQMPRRTTSWSSTTRIRIRARPRSLFGWRVTQALTTHAIAVRRWHSHGHVWKTRHNIR